MLKSWSWLKDDYAQVLVLVERLLCSSLGLGERLLCSSLGQAHHDGTNAYLVLKVSANTKFCFQTQVSDSDSKDPISQLIRFETVHGSCISLKQIRIDYVSVLYVYIWNLKRLVLK